MAGFLPPKSAKSYSTQALCTSLGAGVPNTRQQPPNPLWSSLNHRLPGVTLRKDTGSGAPRGPLELACLTSPPGVPGGHPTCVSSATCRRILGASLSPSSSVPVLGRHPLTTELQDPSPFSHSCRGLSMGCFWPLDKLCLARMAFLRIGIFHQCLKPGRSHVVMPAMLSPSPPPGARDPRAT